MAMPVEDKSVQQMQATGARIVQGTPGLAEKLVASSRTQLKSPAGAAPGSAGAGNRDDRDAIIIDLQRQLDMEKEKNRSLEDQVKYRIASFVKREAQTKNKIESLERRLNEGTDDDEHMQRMGVIENMHKCVMGGLDCIQTNTAHILQEQEKDLMRAFRARLQEVSKELESQRSRKGEHATELQARHRRVVAELHEAQELAQTFDKKNQQLASENQKLSEKLRTREDDRQCLLRQLVIAKKEIARLKALCKESTPGGVDARASFATSSNEQSSPEASASAPAKKSFSQKQIDQAKLMDTRNRNYEREVKYREAVTRLRRMVEAERRKFEVLKRQQAEMLQQRTELEVLLRQCVYDVKSEIVRYRAGQVEKDGGPKLPTSDETYAAMSIHDLKPQDRERVLELLLSQQRVVQLLYSKTFPNRQPPPSGEEEVIPKEAPPKEDEFAWLADIIPDEGQEEDGDHGEVDELQGDVGEDGQA